MKIRIRAGRKIIHGSEIDRGERAGIRGKHNVKLSIFTLAFALCLAVTLIFTDLFVSIFTLTLSGTSSQKARQRVEEEEEEEEVACEKDEGYKVQESVVDKCWSIKDGLCVFLKPLEA